MWGSQCEVHSNVVCSQLILRGRLQPATRATGSYLGFVFVFVFHLSLYLYLVSLYSHHSCYSPGCSLLLVLLQKWQKGKTLHLSTDVACCHRLQKRKIKLGNILHRHFLLDNSLLVVTILIMIDCYLSPQMQEWKSQLDNIRTFPLFRWLIADVENPHWWAMKGWFQNETLTNSWLLNCQINLQGLNLRKDSGVK